MVVLGEHPKVGVMAEPMKADENLDLVDVQILGALAVMQKAQAAASCAQARRAG